MRASHGRCIFGLARDSIPSLRFRAFGGSQVRMLDLTAPGRRATTRAMGDRLWIRIRRACADVKMRRAEAQRV